MNIISVSPKSDLLKNYIDSFYIITRTASEKQTDVIVFPHVNVGLSIVKQNQLIKVSDNYYEVRFKEGEKFNSILAHGYNNPIHINYSGAFQEISIIFKPLGINAFLENDIASYFVNDSLHTFIPFSDFEVEMGKILELNDATQQLEILEKYLENKCIGFEHELLTKALEAMNSEAFSVKEFAQKHHISVKSFIHQFKKYSGRTPAQHYKITRFRNSIRKNTSDYISLTETALASGYFDQSHFIKDFKKLTGKKPKDFFKSIDVNHKSKMIYLMN